MGQGWQSRCNGIGVVVDEGSRLTVSDDVGGLRRGQSVTNGHDDRANASDAVPHSEQLDAVVHLDCH